MTVPNGTEAERELRPLIQSGNQIMSPGRIAIYGGLRVVSWVLRSLVIYRAVIKDVRGLDHRLIAGIVRFNLLSVDDQAGDNLIDARLRAREWAGRSAAQ
jgi:hypothetical protein